MRPTPLAGAAFQYVHNRAGHPAFLLGQHSDVGWWYYFPCVLFFKSTPAEYLLACLAAVGVMRAALARLRSQAAPDVSLAVWLCGGGVFLAMIVFSRINIGQRYALPLYPLLCLVAVDRIWVIFSTKWLRVGVASLAIALQTVSAATVAPQFLGFVSPIVGGPATGYRLIADSNIDWGQDLIRLRDLLPQLGFRRVAIKFFGTVNPAWYGIDSERWDDETMMWSEDREALVISVTFLQGVYTNGRDPFRELRLIAPAGRAGWSLMVYDLHDPAVRQALQAARSRLQLPHTEASSSSHTSRSDG
jgi:hypothetical protein